MTEQQKEIDEAARQWQEFFFGPLTTRPSMPASDYIRQFVRRGKPLYVKQNGQWVKGKAYERSNGAWVEIK